MQRTDNHDLVCWLEEAAGEQLFAGIEPPGYPAYGRIFHAMYELTNPPSALSGVSHDQADRLLADAGERPPAIVGGFDLRTLGVTTGVSVGWTRRPAGCHRLRWRDFAKRNGIAFSGSEIHERLFRPALADGSWPVSIQPPPDGSLDVESFSRLVELLLRYGNADVTAYYCLLALKKWEGNAVLEGRLSEMGQLIDNPEARTSPQNWWPGDRSWVVYTDYDLTTTTVAGSAELIERLVGDDFIECYSVEHRQNQATDT